MAINKDRAHEVDHGLIVNHTDLGNTIEGPFYTGGPSSPIGLNLPESSVYIQNKSDGLVIWRKFGNNIDDWTIYDGSVRCDDLVHDLTVPENTVKLLAPRKIHGCIRLSGRIKVI